MAHKFLRDHHLPSPSSPYFEFGVQNRRFPFMWNGGQGGIVGSAQANTHSPSSSLGNADMLESGYGDPNWIPWPAFNNTILHSSVRTRDRRRSLGSLGDWPLVRPSGPEPLSPGESGVPLGMSDNEKTLAVVLAAGAAAWFLFLRKGRRRNPGNPGRRGYYVISKTHGVQGAIVLPSKREAVDYANYLRRSGKKARIKKR